MNFKHKNWFILLQALVLIGILVLVYLPSFNSEFYLDDGRIIVSNIYIRILDLKPSSLFRAGFQDGKNNRPLTNISFALNYYFGGYNPFGYHLVNFLILILTAFGVWLTLLKLLAQLGYEHSQRALIGWLIALVWSVHPLNIQAISYVTQRYASMAGAFSIWTIYFYHLGQEKRKGQFYFLAFLFCIFALLSKENSLTLPLLLLGYKVYFFDKLAPGWLRRNWKWILALFIFYLLAVGALFRPEFLKRIETDLGKMPYSAWSRSLTEFRVLVWYLGLILFPFPQFLSLVHDFQASKSIFHPPTTVICLFIIFGIILLAIYKARSSRIFSFAVFWYLGQLLVEAMPLPIDLVHEHRLYLASLSIIGPLIGGLILKSNRLKLTLIGIGLIITFFAGFSWQRNQLRETNEKLYKDTVRKAPRFYMAWDFYCKALSKKGKYHRAIPACQMALHLHPHYSTHLALGVIYLQAEELELAEEELKKAIEIWPLVYGAHNYLGFCYLKMGKLELAEKELLKAVELSPESAVLPFYNLALLYTIKNDYENAVKWFQATIERDPSNVKAHYLLAQNYRLLKREEDYLKEMRKTVELSPEWKKARLELVWALAEKNACPEAIKWIKNAPEPDPQFMEILHSCPNPKGLPTNK